MADDAGDEEAEDVADEDEDGEDEEDEDGEEEEEEEEEDDSSSSTLFTEGRNLSYVEGRDTEGGKADSDALVSFSEPLPSSIVFRLTFAKLSVSSSSSSTLAG